MGTGYGQGMRSDERGYCGVERKGHGWSCAMQEMGLMRYEYVERVNGYELWPFKQAFQQNRRPSRFLMKITSDLHYPCQTESTLTPSPMAASVATNMARLE